MEWNGEAVANVLRHNLQLVKKSLAARTGLEIRDRPTRTGEWMYFPKDGSRPCMVTVEAIEPHPNGNPEDVVLLIDGEHVDPDTEMCGLWGESGEKGASHEKA